MMNTLILEDNIEQAKSLERLVKNTYNTSSVYVSHNCAQALELTQEHSFDLFILDIILNPDDSLTDNGIEFASYIRKQKQYSHTPIIFITSFPEHMQSAINDAHCYSFIIKPYTSEDVVKTLMEVSDFSDYDSSFIKIKDYTGIIFKIRITDIHYIESNGHRITIHTDYSSYDTGEFTLEKIEHLLPDNFIRCHKKYIINISKISNYDRTNRFIQISSVIIPVGRTYKITIDERLLK